MRGAAGWGEHAVEFVTGRGSVTCGRLWRSGWLLVAGVLFVLGAGLVGLAARAQAAPSGHFASVSAGSLHTCGVRANETVDCWGDNRYGQARPPAGAFRTVSAGGSHTCGVRSDETVTCWGNDRYGQATALTGTFRSVSAGGGHTCGVRTNGTVACWGNDSLGMLGRPRACSDQ